MKRRICIKPNMSCLSCNIGIGANTAEEDGAIKMQ